MVSPSFVRHHRVKPGDDDGESCFICLAFSEKIGGLGVYTWQRCSENAFGARSADGFEAFQDQGGGDFGVIFSGDRTALLEPHIDPVHHAEE